jgi:putative sugar O-methyltransferase
MSNESDLWLQISNRLKTEEFSLKDFRNPEEAWINSKLASWKPNENTLRWYRSFVLAKSNLLDAYGYTIYKEFGDTSLGNPVEVRIARPVNDLRGEVAADSEFMNINLDYLLVIGELVFLEESFENMEFPKTIVEIGAGFGRTCHGLLSRFDSISRYEIIDLSEVLKISRSYLQSVLSESNFKKVIFISAENTEKEFSTADLCIQIDGLQEMEVETIDFYYKYVIQNCSSFYSSNPIAKYLPEHAGITTGVEIPPPVFSLGKSRDIADIWDMQDLEENREKHTLNYLPENFTIFASEPQDIFPHYENTMYKKNR